MQSIRFPNPGSGNHRFQRTISPGSVKYKSDVETSEKAPKTKKSKKVSKLLPLTLAIVQLFAFNSCNKNMKTNNTDYSYLETPTVTLEEFNPDYAIESSKNLDVSDDLIAAIEEADSFVTDKSFSKYARKGIDIIQDAAMPETRVVNGYIDEPAVQGNISDCWFLTALNNLSYTEQGAKIIHDAISQKSNGDFEVYFKGPDLKYIVTMDELKYEGFSKYSIYSHGDNDVLLLELAAMKFRKDIKEGNIELKKVLILKFITTLILTIQIL